MGAGMHQSALLWAQRAFKRFSDTHQDGSGIPEDDSKLRIVHWKEVLLCTSPLRRSCYQLPCPEEVPLPLNVDLHKQSIGPFQESENRVEVRFGFYRLFVIHFR